MKKIFLEIFVVTIGILIAILLNNWNENRKELALADDYLVGLIEEMNENRLKLDDKLAYHKKLLETLNTDPMNARMVLSPARVVNTAWKLSENNVFKKHVDREIYKQLSNVYQLHDGLFHMSKNASIQMSEINIMGPYYYLGANFDKITEEEGKRIKVKMKQGWIPIFETWTYFEEEYLSSIDSTLMLISQKTNLNVD